MQDESVATPAARCSTSADGDLTRRQRMAVVISSFDSPGNPHYGGGGANMVEMIARWLAAEFEVTVVTAARRGGTTGRDGGRYRQLPGGWAGPRARQPLFPALVPVVALRMVPCILVEGFP